MIVIIYIICGVLFLTMNNSAWDVRMGILSTGQVGINTTSTSHYLGKLTSRENFGNSHVSNLTLACLGGSQGLFAGLSMYPTFTGTGDSGPRRAVDLYAGFNGAWGGEFLSICVGKGGAANDSGNITNEQVKISTYGSVHLNNQPRGCLIRSSTISSTGLMNVFGSGYYEGITRKGLGLSSGIFQVPSFGNGTYRVTATLVLRSTATTVEDHAIYIYKNGGSIYGYACGVHSSVDPVVRSVDILIDLAVGDTIGIYADSSSTTTLYADAGSSFTMMKVA